MMDSSSSGDFSDVKKGYSIAGASVTSGFPVEVWLSEVGGIAQSVTTDAPLKSVLDLIAETSCRMMGYDFCGVLLANVDRTQLVIEGAHGLSADYLGKVNDERPIRLGSGALGEGPSSRAFISRSPVAISDVTADESFGPWAGVAFDQGYRSMVAVPMSVGGRDPVGTLNCYTTAPHEFGSAEVVLLQAIANQAAIAIESARLHKVERERIEELSSLNRSLEIQKSMLRRAEQIHRELTELALAEGGLDAVSGALSTLLDVTVCIDIEQNEGFGRPEPVQNDRLRDLRTYPEVEEAIRHFTDVPVVREMTLSIRNAADESDPLSLAIAPVMLQGRLVACVWALDLDSELDPLSRRALEHAAIIAAHELLKFRAAREAEWRRRSDLIDDLLEAPVMSGVRISSSSNDREALFSRALSLGHDLTQPHRILLVRFDDRNHEPVSVTSVHESISSRGMDNLVSIVERLSTGSAPKPLVAVHRDTVAMLLPEITDPPWQSPNAIAQNICEEAVRLLDANVSVVIGRVVESPQRYGATHRQARSALELVTKRGADNAIISVDSMGVYALLLLVDNSDDLNDFADYMLAPIRDYDQEYRTELEYTIRTHLENGLSARKTAKTLHIHVNTLAQRLNRIGELLDTDIRSTEILFQLHLALMIVELPESTPI